MRQKEDKAGIWSKLRNVWNDCKRGGKAALLEVAKKQKVAFATTMQPSQRQDLSWTWC